MTRLPFIRVTNLNNELSPIMTRLPSIGVTKSKQRTISHNEETTIHWSNKSQQQTSPILTRLPFIGVNRSQQ